MALRYQVRHKGGQERLQLEADTTMGTFAELLAEKSGIPVKRLKLRAGFPPKPLGPGLEATASVSSVVPSGESLIAEESDEPTVAMPMEPEAEGGAATSSASAVQRPLAPKDAPPVNTSGVGVRRVVDADNSCLFTSLGYVLLGKDRKAGMALRDVVAKEVLADPDNYNAAVLEREPSAYAEWIKGTDHWGGGIELAVLSDHFSAVIMAWDIQTKRCDRYGEDKSYKQCVHLIYDGLHYDALALSILEDVPPESEEFDITVFSPEDEFMTRQAKVVVEKMHKAKSFTDTASFTLRCLVCQKGLTGEADAVEHAKATGHQNFAEYR